ncbi:MAG: class I SAM-dependent methyltransferase [Betaproteobacteria bacterium]|nr:class I SAM-dependent methyltransferase [Betaproteobacteria bacterium]
MSFDQDFLDKFYTRLSQIYDANDARQSGYQFSWWFRRLSNIVKRQLIVHEIDPAVVIDLGCGSGLFLQQAFPESQNLIGVDYNESACLRALARGIRAVRADLFNLPFKDSQASTVCCINVLQQFEHNAVADLLKSVSNLLKPEGVFILVWRNNASGLHKIAKLSSLLNRKEDKHPAWHGHSLQAISEHLHSNNFEIKGARLIAPIFGCSLRTNSTFGNFFGTEFFVLAAKSLKNQVRHTPS